MSERLLEGPLQVVLSHARGNLTVVLQVVLSPRLQRLRLQVRHDRILLLKLPRRASLRQGMAFLQSKADWIAHTLERTPQVLPLAEWLTQQPWLSLDGAVWPVALHRGAARGRIVWPGVDRCLHLWLDARLPDEEQILAALRKTAQRYLPLRLATLAEQAGLAPRVERVSVRDQRSRWGSCSSGGNLSFNWRLILLPVMLHDYVLHHELAHLCHLNHSDAYWRFLDKLHPQALAHDAELTRVGRPLFALGRKSPTPI